MEKEQGSVKGYYYGTSDDFDQAREGYYVGFFVLQMQNLTLNDGMIEFTLTLTNEDIYGKEIPLQFKSGSELPKGKFKKWGIPLKFYERKYRGKILRGKIIFNFKEDDPIGETERVFHKI